MLIVCRVCTLSVGQLLVSCCPAVMSLSNIYITILVRPSWSVNLILKSSELVSYVCLKQWYQMTSTIIEVVPYFQITVL